MAKTSRKMIDDAPADPRPGDGLDAAAAAGFEGVPRTRLVRLLLAARREYLTSGRRFLSREEIEREVAERRAGNAARDDE